MRQSQIRCTVKKARPLAYGCALVCEPCGCGGCSFGSARGEHQGWLGGESRHAWFCRRHHRGSRPQVALKYGALHDPCVAGPLHQQQSGRERARARKTEKSTSRRVVGKGGQARRSPPLSPSFVYSATDKGDPIAIRKRTPALLFGRERSRR